MKFFIMLVMLSTMLFSGQKQIILGSYSVKSNGERALKSFNNQIENDIQLQDFMKDYSLRTINTEISGYTVVSLNAFNSYKELLNAMKALKVYYGDAYVLKYPTKNIRLSESFEDISKKAKMEEETALAKEASLAEQAQLAEDEAKRIELKKLLEMDSMNENETDQIENEVSVEAVEVVEETVQEEIPALEEKVIEEESSQEEVSQEEVSNPMEKYMLYIIALVLLALIAAGFTVVKIANAKSSKSQENE